jgi:hypothetical protein
LIFDHPMYPVPESVQWPHHLITAWPKVS